MAIDVEITIIDREGKAHFVQAPTDMSLNLMEVCKMYELPVEGTCGGMALCASCQVYVLSNHELPKPNDSELAMLDQAFNVQENSRLGCQLHIHENMQGLTVGLAPEE